MTTRNGGTRRRTHGLARLATLGGGAAIMLSATTSSAVHAQPAPSPGPTGDVVSEASIHPVEHIEYPDVRSISQDQHGFIWFGINHQIKGGLVRYDGYETVHYTSDFGDDTSLSHNQVSLTYIDHDDTLWVGTIRGGLNRYNADTDDFTRYLHDPDDDTSLPSDDIESMLQAADGTFWIATETGLARLDPDTGSAISFFNDPDDPNSLPANRVRVLAEDTDSGELWIGTAAGLSIFNPRESRFRNYAHDPDDPTTISDDSVESIFRDSDGVWWLGTEAGLVRYRPETDDFERLRLNDPAAAEDDEPEVTAILEDSKGRLWVGHEHGLSQLDRTLGEPVPFTDAQTLQSILGDTPVQTLLEDVDGGIWIGTQTGGAARISPIPKSVKYHRHDPEADTSIGSDFVARIDATDSGLWILTDVGVEFFDGASFTDHTAHFELNSGWPEVSGILAPDDDRIWLGFNDGQVAHFDVESGERTAHDLPAPADDSAAVPIALAQNGDLWYRIPWGFGVGVVRTDGNSELLIGEEVDIEGDERAYSFNTAHYFDADEQVLWITGLGLTRIDVTTGDVDVYSFNPDNPTAVANHLWSVDKGPDGHLWLASGLGVHEFDPATGTYLNLVNDGLPAAGATDARFGPDGRLWIVAGPTLAGLDTDTGDVLAYTAGEEAGPSDRLPMENWVSSKFEVGADDRMYAPTLDQGLISFSPLDLVANPVPPRVVLTKFSVFGEPVDVGSATLPAPVHATDQIHLAPNQNTFTFEFSALNYEHPEHNQYRYQLEGFDNGWQDTTADRRIATYTNVPPGKYTFRVEASNNSGVWTKTPLAVSIIVATPWYETWWARLLAALGVAAVIFAVYRWRTRQQRQRTRELEERLTERIEHQHERELLLAQVQQQSERLESILAAAPIGVVLLGSDREVLMQNTVAEAEFAALSTRSDDGQLLTFAGLEIDDLIGRDSAGTWAATAVDAGGEVRSLSVAVRPIDHAHQHVATGHGADTDLGTDTNINTGTDINADIDTDTGTDTANYTSDVDSSGVAELGLHDRSSTTLLTPQGWVLLWDDITELEALQQRRARQDRLAAVGRFAAGIAHDVNNVLNVIGLNADLLHLDPQVAGRSRDHLDQITRETGNASKFITQILDFSRQSVSEIELLDAHSVVGNQVRQLAEVMGPGVQFEFFGQSPARVWADPIQLERIVLNLVKNAQDAVGDNGTITVVVDHVPSGLVGITPAPDRSEGAATDLWVRIAVNDDGSGIHEDVLPTIFEPFVTTKPAGKGTGLGLAQVAGISAEHGGRVTVETELGAGTTVSVLLPAADPSEFREPKEPVDVAFVGRSNARRAVVVDAEFLSPSSTTPPTTPSTTRSTSTSTSTPTSTGRLTR